MAYTPSLAPELYTDANRDVDIYFRELMRAQDKSPLSTDTSKPRFTLVVGPSPFTMPRGWEFFLTAPYEGATYIATVLHNAGYPVRIVDLRFTPDPLKAGLAQVLRDTDVLGVATFEDNFPWTREFVNQFKELRPDVPVILGGSLVTSVPHIFMATTRADIAVISEGEITILELMDAYTRGLWDKRLEEIRGIWYRGEGGQVLCTPPRGQMMDLDALPRMRLELWPQYHDERGMQPQIISSYSRGCKMDCSFCYRTTPQERAKSPEKMREELTWLKERYGTEFIFFVDLTFTAHKKQTLEMLEAIGEHDLRWTCLTRCADVDPERLSAMREAGSDIILYGVESLGKKILKTARKGNTENITQRAMYQTWDAGVRFGGLLIVGLPGEEEESLEHACEWAEEHKHITRVKYLSAMPGTTVYSQGVSQGYMRSEIDHLNWLSIEQGIWQDEFLNYNGLPEQTLRDAYKRIYESYQPGPVMDFKHYPEHFWYLHGSREDGNEACVDYGGPGWRATHSSAGPPLVPGSERFTLDKVGPPGMVEAGASAPEARALRSRYFDLSNSTFVPVASSAPPAVAK